MKEITVENLKAFGMVVPEDGSEIIFPLEKVLAKSTDDDGHDRVLALCVTRERNADEIALKLPGGDTLFLGGVSCIEDLEVIEKCIMEFEPNY